MPDQIDAAFQDLLTRLPASNPLDVTADRVFAHLQRLYDAHVPGASLVEFTHGPALYLFDLGSETRSERTIACVAQPAHPSDPRDETYQRGFPTRGHRHGRALDRGHFVAFSSGGLFGPNLFDQDRALNRGWSLAGRRYRALENRAAQTPGATLIVVPTYVDDSDFPAFLDLAVLDGAGACAERFRNRYDVINGTVEDELAIHLDGATTAAIGGLGEETAAAWIESKLDGTIVALGDAGMPRTNGKHDLDVLAIVEGELIAFEVKTRFHSRGAGRLTKAGNLHRPRLRRPSDSATSPKIRSDRQGSQQYVTDRLHNHIDTTPSDYEGIQVRVVAVDLIAFMIQQFSVNDSGTTLIPIGPPRHCKDAAEAAAVRIVEHRGHL